MDSATLITGSGLSGLALVGLMGLRHGFDADHIAVVDGLTRSRSVERSAWAARWVGLQFAAGHSAVILLAALLLYHQSAALPAWLDGLGRVISSVFLLVVGASSAQQAWHGRGRAAHRASLSGMLLRLTGRHLHPALVGMAFALSFDALAQALFFASQGSSPSGLCQVVALAGVFGAGMVVSDALNGALLGWASAQGDAWSRRMGRAFSAAVALLALGTAAWGLARVVSPWADAAWGGIEPWLGPLALLLAVGAGVLLWRGSPAR